MERMTVAEFQAAIRAQGVAREDFAVVCPCCKTVQSARDFFAAGVGPDLAAVREHFGFSCVGRWTGAGSPRREPDGKPCNGTLGGFLNAHELEVVTEDGEAHPHFRPATPEQARAHAAGNSTLVAP